MVVAAFVLSIVALVLALRASGSVKSKVEALERDARFRDSKIASVREELEAQIATLRRHTAQIVDGASPSASMIRDGRLFEDIDAREAHRLVTEEAGTVVVDVRTYDEWAGGHVPDALHIPVEELERRWAEVPKDAPRVVVHCAMGGRSAAACDFLSSEKGYANLRNVAGPLIGAWPGEVQRAGGG